MLFIIRFVGRKLGADGITYEITEQIDASSHEEARDKLYEKYEHIRILVSTQIS